METFLSTALGKAFLFPVYRRGNRGSEKCNHFLRFYADRDRAQPRPGCCRICAASPPIPASEALRVQVGFSVFTSTNNQEKKNRLAGPIAIAGHCEIISIRSDFLKKQ